MKTTILDKDNRLTAILDGRLDTAASAETEKALLPLYDSNGQDIVFDCHRLEYISSSGLRLLLGVLKNVKPKGSRVVIEGISPDIRKVFDMTGFTNLFTII